MITIQKRPDKFSPVGNPVIWQVVSDNSDLVYFKVKVIDESTSAVINQLDIFPTPALPNGSYINLSRLLSNVVAWEVNNDSFQLVVPLHKTIRSYRLEITERVLDTNGTLVDGDQFNDTTDFSYIWNAEVGRISHHNYVQSKYVMNQSSLASFLTNKPNHTRVNDISAEHLYFLQDGSFQALNARVRFYDGGGSMVDMVYEPVTDLADYQMYRLNVSPKALKDSNNVDFSSVSYYVVDLVNHLGVSKSVERIYLYEEVECWRDYMVLMWVNSLGGLDSYTFIAPQDTIQVQRFNMKKNPYGVNSEGVYSDLNDGIYNPSDVTLDRKVTTSTRIHSKELSDLEAYWLQELYMSKQVFVELTDLALVPCMVNQNSYKIERKKYNRGQLNTIALDVVMADGVIPAASQAYSPNISTIQFIDRQMNTLTQNLPGFGITFSNTGPRNYSGNYTHNYT